MNKLLVDKVALVVGSSRTVVASIVQKLLLEGVRVILPAKSAQEVALLSQRIGGVNTDKLVTLLVDYPDYDKAFELAECVKEKYGKIDLAVICFDTPVSEQLLTKTDIIDWEKMVDHSITTFFVAAHVVLGNMRENKQGMFISINSANDTINKCPSALGSISRTMQTEMAKVFYEEGKLDNIKCYHLITAHSKTPEINTTRAEIPRIAEDDIGVFIVQLFKENGVGAEHLFQKFAVNAAGTTAFGI
ncbi:MAG TPA: SDR family NAD(P)-dependent oxidoreductase [Puia sp.]|jgi:NADP-dependent 3-hydroxy acid dehydrogenase YdfG|nr:SDR family NAD(P)-dependent oxidoreductase [Puia sp.]